MTEIFLIWFPIVAATIMPILLRTKKVWKAFFIILFTYVIVSLVEIIIIIMGNVVVAGQADPTLVAGQIAEHLVSSVLASIIVIPVALLLFVCWRKFRGKAEKGTE